MGIQYTKLRGQQRPNWDRWDCVLLSGFSCLCFKLLHIPQCSSAKRIHVWLLTVHFKGKRQVYLTFRLLTLMPSTQTLRCGSIWWITLDTTYFTSVLCISSVLSVNLFMSLYVYEAIAHLLMVQLWPVMVSALQRSSLSLVLVLL